MDRRKFLYIGAAGAVGASIGSVGCGPGQPRPTGKAAKTDSVSAPEQDLELNFEGLMAFARPGTAQSPWSVIFVKTEDLTHPIEHHWPLLRIRTASLDSSTQQPPPPPSGAPEPASNVWQWDLTDTEVTVLRGGQPANEGVDLDTNSRPHGPDGKPVPCAATSAEQADVSWLADLTLACGNGALYGALLTGVPGQVPRLGARVKFGAGRMACRHGKSNVNAIFSINSNYEQNFADVVAVQVPSRGAPLVIRLQRGTQTTDIAFKPTEHQVVAQFKNMVGGNPAPGDSRKSIDHFAAYYELLATPPAASPIPTYKSECDGTVVHGHQPTDPQLSPLDPPFYCPPVTGNAP